MKKLIEKLFEKYKDFVLQKDFEDAEKSHKEGKIKKTDATKNN